LAHLAQLRFCVDSRALNAITKRDNYPLSRIDELLGRLAGAKFFMTSLDLASGYWQIIIIMEADVEKTAFQTRYGSFEFLVMPFGLTNAPSAFQRLMNQIFGAAADRDDLLIFSRTWEDHIKHVKQVMDKLQENF
jgi:DNA-binding NtrC family response regulator